MEILFVCLTISAIVSVIFFVISAFVVKRMYANDTLANILFFVFSTVIALSSLFMAITFIMFILFEFFK